MIVVLILTVLALFGGFYSFYAASSSSIYTYLGGIALVIAGILMKSLFDLFTVRRREKKEGIKLLKALLMECEKNLELIESKKIRWSQVHFDVVSYTTAREKTALTTLPSALLKQIEESYKLVSEIEKRKLRAFDKTTDMMLEKLAEELPKVIKELKKITV